MSVIKECPHCGGDATLRVTHDREAEVYLICVECLTCGATGKAYPQVDSTDVTGWYTSACCKAVNAWNKRYTPPADETGDRSVYIAEMDDRQLM